MPVFKTACAAIRSVAPGALVVTLGMDAPQADPLAGLAITADGSRRIGGMIAQLDPPTMLVQEGCYFSDILGINRAAFPADFGAARYAAQ